MVCSWRITAPKQWHSWLRWALCLGMGWGEWSMGQAAIAQSSPPSVCPLPFLLASPLSILGWLLVAGLVFWVGFRLGLRKLQQRPLTWQQREVSFRLAMTAVPMGVWQIDLRSGKQIWSPETEAIFGMAPGTFDGTVDTFLNRVHPDDRGLVKQAIRTALETGLYQPEYRIILPDQRIRWLLSQARIIYDDQGYPIQMVGVDVDITERKQMEESLRNSEAELRALFTAMTDVVTVRDIEGRCLKIAPTNAETFYKDPLEMVGKTTHETFPSPQANILLNGIRTALSQGKTIEIEYCLDIQEKPVWLSARVSPMTEDSVIIVARDISDRKRAEVELRRQKELLQTIFDHLPIMVGLYSAQGEILVINRELERVIGWDKEDYKRVDVLRECYPDPKDYEAVVAHIITADSTWKDFKTKVRDGRILDTSWIQIRLSDGRSIGIGQNITHRKQAEEALAANERRLRTIIEAEPECVKILDADGTILEMNPAGLTMLQADHPDQVIGQNVFSCILPEYHQALSAMGNSVFQGESGQLEFAILGRKGTQRWVDSHMVPLRNEHNEIISILAITRDITDRKAAEMALQRLNDELELRIEQRTAALQASEARFRGFFDFAPIGIAVADVQTHRFTAVNQAFCELLGYSESELLALGSCVSVSVPEDWEVERPYAESLLGGEANVYHIEKRYFKKSGDIIVGSLTTTALRNEAGQITHLLGMLEDITQRQVAEAQLRKNDAHLRAAQRIGKLGSWEYAVQTGQLTWSEEVFRIYGLDPAQGIPTYAELQHYIHPEDWEHFNQTVEAAIATGQPYDLEHRLIQPDGTLVYVLARGEIIYDSTGQLTHIIGTALDITNRKLAEQKLQQTVTQLAATNRELESFSYSVSHDLRAPLRHINGFVNALRQKLDSHHALTDPKVAHYLQVIENSSQKMAQLIDGLLTLSRIGRKSMAYESVELRDLVGEAIALVQSQQEATPSVEFVIGELPIVQGDATLLQQVWVNLISNAVKFSRRHPTPRVEIGSLPDGTLFIRDNGVGFDMKYTDQLFGAFQRLHVQTEFEGTGIGLAIVQRIIHRHGGTIWAVSQVNQGATFYFTLGSVGDTYHHQIQLDVTA